MTRRYAPRSIEASHALTARAESLRRPAVRVTPPGQKAAEPKPSSTSAPAQKSTERRVVVAASKTTTGGVTMSRREVDALKKQITEAVTAAPTEEARQALRRVRRSLNTRSTT